MTLFLEFRNGYFFSRAGLLERPAVQCTEVANRARRSNNDGAQPGELHLPAHMEINATVIVNGQTARADLSELRDLLQNTIEA